MELTSLYVHLISIAIPRVEGHGEGRAKTIGKAISMCPG